MNNVIWCKRSGVDIVSIREMLLRLIGTENKLYMLHRGKKREITAGLISTRAWMYISNPRYIRWCVHQVDDEYTISAICRLINGTDHTIIESCATPVLVKIPFWRKAIRWIASKF